MTGASKIISGGEYVKAAAHHDHVEELYKERKKRETVLSTLEACRGKQLLLGRFPLISMALKFKLSRVAMWNSVLERSCWHAGITQRQEWVLKAEVN